MNYCQFFLFFCEITVVVFASHSEDEEKKALKYLRQYGYISMIPEGRSVSHPKDVVFTGKHQLSKPIKEFQKFVGLPITGKLDNDTVTAFEKPRCGVPDIRTMPRDVVGFKWSKNKLTWRLGSNPLQISRNRTREALQEAFNVWSDAIPLDFEEVPQTAEKADFTIEFARYSHGDPWPFDGRGRVLAHAMFPPDGRTHFDSDETWAYRDENIKRVWDYTDLLAVAIHELGHALGLGHSRAHDSIMAPFYKTADVTKGYQTPTLGSRDLWEIQRIYGKRTKPRPNPGFEPTTRPPKRFYTTTSAPATTKTTTMKTTRKPFRPRPTTRPRVVIPEDEPVSAECPTFITAATKALNGKSYVFSTDKVWEFDDKRKRIGRMRLVSDLFPGGPTTVTAAVTNPRTHFTILFENRKVYAYLWNQDSSTFNLYGDYPKTLSDKVSFVPTSGFIWRDGNFVLINGSDFVTYDPNWNVPTMVNLTENYFPNFPKSVSGALPTGTNNLLLFHKRQAFLYDMNTRRLINQNGVNLKIIFKC